MIYVAIVRRVACRSVPGSPMDTPVADRRLVTALLATVLAAGCAAGTDSKKSVELAVAKHREEATIISRHLERSQRVAGQVALSAQPTRKNLESFEAATSACPRAISWPDIGRHRRRIG